MSNVEVPKPKLKRIIMSSGIDWVIPTDGDDRRYFIIPNKSKINKGAVNAE